MAFPPPISPVVAALFARRVTAPAVVGAKPPLAKRPAQLALPAPAAAPNSGAPHSAASHSAASRWQRRGSVLDILV